MNILFFDTETTGLPLWKEPSDDPRQPRICELAASMRDETGKVIQDFHCRVKPDGWTIPEEAAKIHGITTEMANATGIHSLTMLSQFRTMYTRANLVVGHAVEFDLRMMRIEFKRHFRVELPDRKAFCTMRAASSIMKMKATEKMMAYGINKPKPPKLTEAYKHFFGEELTGAHGAKADMEACARIYYHLKQPEAA